MTRKKKITLSSLTVIATLAAIAIYGWSGRVDYTRDDLTVLQETGDYVELSYKGNTGRLYKNFAFDFDDPDLLNWFGDQRWSAMTLLSPMNKTVREYVALQNAIRAGETDFADNRIDTVDGAVRFTSVEPSYDMVTAKSMLQNDRLWFVKGDDLWFTGRYFIESGVPFTIVDFQERGRIHSPGPRITIWNGKFIGMEMKYILKPSLKQFAIEVPLGRWFDLKVHMVLDNEEGEVQIWQDGVLIIDDKIQTLPEENSVLNALEIGITATSQAAVLLVDDIAISHEPL